MLETVFEKSEDQLFQALRDAQYQISDFSGLSQEIEIQKSLQQDQSTLEKLIERA